MGLGPGLAITRSCEFWAPGHPSVKEHPVCWVFRGTREGTEEEKFKVLHKGQAHCYAARYRNRGQSIHTLPSGKGQVLTVRWDEDQPGG